MRAYRYRIAFQIRDASRVSICFIIFEKMVYFKNINANISNANQLDSEIFTVHRELKNV